MWSKMTIADSEKFKAEQQEKKMQIKRQKDELRNYYAE